MAAKDDEMPVFKADILDEDWEDEIVYKEPAPITSGGLLPVNPTVSSINAVEKWREMSEKYKLERTGKEPVPRAAPAKPVPKQLEQYQKYQSNYEKDSLSVETPVKSFKPLVSDMIGRLQSARIEVDLERVLETPEEDFGLPQEGVLRIGNVMRQKVLCVLASMPIEQVASILNTRQITGVPVLDDQSGELVGLMTRHDLWQPPFEAEILLSLQDGTSDIEALMEKPVRDFMIKNVVSVTPDLPVQDVCQLMLKQSIHRVVVALEKQVKGIFTASDALKILATHSLEVIL